MECVGWRPISDRIFLSFRWTPATREPKIWLRHIHHQLGGPGQHQPTVLPFLHDLRHVVAFVISNHDNFRTCVPPIPQIASASSPSLVASWPPNPGPGGPFGLRNTRTTYQQTILERLQGQNGQDANDWSNVSGYMTPLLEICPRGNHV